MTKKLQELYKEMKKLQNEFNEIESKFDNFDDWSDELENESDVAYEKYYKSLEECIYLLMTIIDCSYVVAKDMLHSEKMEKIMQYNII